MKITLRALSFLVGFLPALAAAQQFPVVPGQTVIGRSSSTSGPAQAIPYATLLSNLAGSQSANKVYAGPSSGSANTPGFRLLVGADLPAPGASSLGGVQSLTCSSHNWFNTLSTGGVLGCSQPAFSDLTGQATFSQLPNTTADNLIGNPTGSSAAPTNVPLVNCANALTYSTSSHTFGCNGSTSVDPTFFPNFIGGLVLSNDGTSPNTVLDIAAGVANDSTNAALMKLGAFTKSTAGAWASGSGSNGMGNGLTIANSTWYHVCLANNSGTPDIWFDTSAVCANRPAGIADTKFRRIGSFRTDGTAHILAFSQNNNEFLWSTSVSDANTVSVTTTASLVTLTVPTGVKVNALFRGRIGSTTAGVNLIFTSPDETDQAAAAPQFDLTTSPSASSFTAGRFEVRTNTSAQIRARSDQAGGINLYVGTFGWIDRRGQ